MSEEKKMPGLWQLSGLALCLFILASAGLSRAADLVVDGGATYTVKNNATFADAYIGNLTTGTVNQGNSTINLTHVLYLGYNPGSSGTYNLSGGSLSGTISQIIGYQGTGVFNQSGGTNANEGNLALGNETGSKGTYNQSG
ncbi:MAG TPA: hypothetical protein VIN67_04010, partial [Desulfobaccales bacterium]